MTIPIPVVCLTYCKWYDSISYASKLTNTTREQIINCCKGKQAYTTNEYGTKLEWMYVDTFVEHFGEEAFWDLFRTTQDFYVNEVEED